MEPIKIACVVGTRPNFVKMAALTREIRRRPVLSFELIHTGQHFSPEMSRQFFDDLGLPEPYHNLCVGGYGQGQQTGAIMQSIAPVLEQAKPALVLVVGDVRSTLGAALAAAELQIPIAHVEAGLRSGDRRMPEEINRIVTDTLSDYLFASEQSGVDNLRAEGVPDDRVFLVGNVMIDTLLRLRDRARESTILSRLDLAPKTYAVATLHRPSNVDDPEQLARLLEVLTAISERIPIVFPAHPRTLRRIESSHISSRGIRLLPPAGYIDFLQLTAESRFVLTDSGGVQEETTILGVPCLTLRENTERPATIQEGTNRLVGVSPDAILAAVQEVLSESAWEGGRPHFWDGHASSRIMDILEERL